MNDFKMDMWKYYDITHRRHKILNPTSGQKMDELIDVLDLKPGAKVIDIGCGKGEMLVRLAERYAISGVGVDMSPFFIVACEQKTKDQVPDSQLHFILGDGAEFQPAPGESADLAICMGASWVFGGHRGTLRALSDMTVPGGLVLVGEPYWREEPDPGYLELAGLEKSTFSSHHGNVVIAEEEGLSPLYTVVSNQDDFDRYDTLQWRAADEYAVAHPEDPDVNELMARVARDREAFLRWGRDCLGWALYLFRKPAPARDRVGQ